MNFSSTEPTWSSYMVQVYSSGKPPVNSSHNIEKVTEKAREVTKDNHGPSADPPSPVPIGVLMS